MTKILVDAMGGDNAPAAPVQGSVIALENDKDLRLVLTGRKEEIVRELSKYKYDKSRLEIVDCPDVIDMNDIPTEAVKRKQSSLIAAFWQLKKEEDACALVTAGYTGATIVGGQLILGRIRGIKRPALCPAIPNNRGGVTLLCDCGANAECKPIMLCQFAVLASAYAEAGFGIKNPKVGLLSNGTEEHKGDPLHQETYGLLKNLHCIDFVGNIEGRDIMSGEIDVAVCDGFSGNIALKTTEGTALAVMKVLKTNIQASLAAKIGYALFMRGTFKKIKSVLDYSKYGGAVMIGIDKVVVKSHGSSKAASVCASVLQAKEAAENKMTDSIQSLLEQIGPEGLEGNEA